MLPPPAYPESDVSQSLPPGGLSGRILEEPSDLELGFDETLSEGVGGKGEGIISPPPPKKQALGESVVDRAPAQPSLVGDGELAEDETGEHVTDPKVRPDVNPEDEASSRPGAHSIAIRKVDQISFETPAEEIEMLADNDMQTTTSLNPGDIREESSTTPQPCEVDIEDIVAADTRKQLPVASDMEEENGMEGGFVADDGKSEEDRETPVEVPPDDADQDRPSNDIAPEEDKVMPVEALSSSEDKPAISPQEQPVSILRDEESADVQVGTAGNAQEDALDLQTPEEEKENASDSVFSAVAIDSTSTTTLGETAAEDETLVADAETVASSVSAKDTKQEKEVAIEAIVKAQVPSVLVTAEALEAGMQAGEDATRRSYEEEQEESTLAKGDANRDTDVSQEENGFGSTAESGLHHRLTQAPGSEDNPFSNDSTASTAVVQASLPPGFFAGLQRRFRHWSFRNRSVLVLGLGFLAITASLVYLGVNFMYDSDSQAERPAATH
jgi:hypothetical protein